MVIYFAIYALLIIGGLFQKRFYDSKAGARNYFIFVFILIAGMLVLRHPSMGIDLGYNTPNGYLASFSMIRKMDWKQLWKTKILNYEKGYAFFCKLIGYITDDPQILLFFCAVIPIFLILYILYKYSDDFLFSVAIYLGLPCFLINYSGLRQAIAIGIVTFSFRFIEKRKLFMFIVAVLFATLFHKSSLIFLFAYPLYHIKPNAVAKCVSLLIIPVIYIFRYPIFTLACKIIQNDAKPDDNNAIVLFLIFVLIYIFMLLFSNDNDPIENGCRNLFWIACLCQAMGGVYSIVIRAGYYYMIFLALSLPKTVGNINFGSSYKTEEKCAVLKCVVAFFFIAFGLYSLYESSWAMSNPYYFFWQNP